MTAQPGLRNRNSRRGLVACTLALAAAVIATGILVPVFAQNSRSPLAELFFENEAQFLGAHTRFPRAAALGNDLFLVSQQILSQSQGTSVIQVQVQKSSDGLRWSQPIPVGERYAQIGEEVPPLFAIAAAANGSELFVAVLESSTSVATFAVSSDLQVSQLGTLSSASTIADPIIAAAPGGQLLLFVNQDVGGRPRLFSSRFAGGRWETFEDFGPARDYFLSFNPSYVWSGNRYRLVFQALLSSDAFNDLFQLGPGLRPNTYQLFYTESPDGRTWSVPRHLSDAGDAGAATQIWEYDNQRPKLAEIAGELHIVWERRAGGGNTRIYHSTITGDGKLGGSPVPVTGAAANASGPDLVQDGGRPVIVYYDTVNRASRVHVATRNFAGAWSTRQLSVSTGVNNFGSLVVRAGKYFAFWQHRADPDATQASIFWRSPDISVQEPRIIPLTHREGQRDRRTELRFQVRFPSDPNGVAAYAISWGTNPAIGPDFSRVLPADDGIFTVPATGDGTWYFAAAVQDGAGNWSSTALSAYIFDSSPPAPVTFRTPATDAAGRLLSNTFSLAWQPPTDEDLASYAVALRMLSADPDSEIPENYAVPLAELLPAGSQPTLSRTNIDDGLWALSVSSVDSVGNRSEPNHLFFRLNKYIPYTTLTDTRAQQNALGQVELSFIGKGYLADGRVDRIVLDKDGQEPWDYDLRAPTDFRVESDTRIGSIQIRNVLTGTYTILINHTSRGWYTARQTISLLDQGTIRFGDYSVFETAALAYRQPGVLEQLIGNTLVFWLLMALVAATAAISLFRLRGVYNDSRILKQEIQAILYQRREGHSVRRLSSMRKQGISLWVKFTALIVLLVISVVALIALPLRSYFLKSQQETLARALDERVSVLLESISSGAENILPTVEVSIIELNQLLAQSEVMPEVEFVTLTSPGNQGSSELDLVWSTTDPVLLGTAALPADIPDELRHLVTRSIGADYIPGEYALTDILHPQISNIAAAINEAARREIGDLGDRITALENERRQLLFSSSTDSLLRRREIDSQIIGIEDRVQSILRGIAGSTRTIPVFDPLTVDPNQGFFLFYKPVVFRPAESSGSDQVNYYQGMIRMGISTAIMQERIAETAGIIQTNIIIFSLIAIVAGVAGAALLSLITVMPIRKLVRAVETIRDTEDKAELHDFSIPIKSRDELFVLSDVIQQMTLGLAKGAETNKELLFGKDIQKMFISLDVGANNTKTTTGSLATEHSAFFGYYEGAKGVSGDYFYYQKITADTYAIIKCDVSGKGISAALIMVEVATLFLNHFSDWEKKQVQRKRVAHALKQAPGDQSGTLPELVTNINDLIAERQFTGKFAALNIVLFNERTGELRFCNAGDNKVYTYRRKQNALVERTLFSAPASGMFNSKDMPIEFREETDRLEFGDILLLFTDGLEESKRTYRNPDGTPKSISEDDIARGVAGDDASPGMQDEEFGMKRLGDLINAIGTKSTFTLAKHLSPWEPEPLRFDFAEADDSPEAFVLGIIAVEKVFRLVPDPKATPDDRVVIDKKIDDFLKTCFDGYAKYFHSPLPEDPNSLYRTYVGIREDDQYDDLTILAVKKL